MTLDGAIDALTDLIEAAANGQDGLKDRYGESARAGALTDQGKQRLRNEVREIVLALRST